MFKKLDLKFTPQVRHYLVVFIIFLTLYLKFSPQVRHYFVVFFATLNF